jgi:hypothetical protein
MLRRIRVLAIGKTPYDEVTRLRTRRTYTAFCRSGAVFTVGHQTWLCGARNGSVEKAAII